MTTLVQWAGDGLSNGAFTTSSVGTGDTAPTLVTKTGSSTIAVADAVASDREQAISFNHVSGGTAFFYWQFTSSTLLTFRAYFTPQARTGNRIILRGYNSGTATQIFTLNVTSTGRSNIYNAANSLAVFGDSGEITADGTLHRVEGQVNTATDTIEIRWYLGESTTPFLTQTNTSDYGAAIDRMYVGNHIASTAAESYQFDDIMVTDTAAWIGPVPAASTPAEHMVLGGVLTPVTEYLTGA